MKIHEILIAFLALSLPYSASAEINSADILMLTNQDRAEYGLPSLKENATLNTAARLKAGDMVLNMYFAHVSPQGKTPWFWFKKAGYQYKHAGENLAVKFITSEAVEKGWMNSPTHRANILNTHYTEIGVATADGVYKGKKTTFIVEVFGTPK